MLACFSPPGRRRGNEAPQTHELIVLSRNRDCLSAASAGGRPRFALGVVVAARGSDAIEVALLETGIQDANADSGDEGTFHARIYGQTDRQTRRHAHRRTDSHTH